MNEEIDGREYIDIREQRIYESVYGLVNNLAGALKVGGKLFTEDAATWGVRLYRAVTMSEEDLQNDRKFY